MKSSHRPGRSALEWVGVTGGDPSSAVAGGVDGAFDETLFLDEVFALCDRFGLPPPAVFQGTGAMRLGEADRADVFDLALSRLARRRPAGLAGAEPALAVLAAPELLISVQREDATSASTCFVASAGATVVEHRPLPDNMHRVARVPSASALAHAIELCALSDADVALGQTVRMTPVQLLEAGVRAAAGDLTGAAGIMDAVGGDSARASFLRALATPPVAVQVTVLERPVPGRLVGTVTAWLDAGDAGLWRVPAGDLAPQGTTGIEAADVVHRVMEIRTVGKRDLIEEIIEGFDGALDR